MLEQITLGQVLVWLLSAGGIAVLLQRIPGWDTLDPRLKTAIVTVLNLVAPFVLAGLKASPIISGAWDQTIANIVFGLGMAALSFLIHLVDMWLAAQSAAAKANTQYALSAFAKAKR